MAAAFAMITANKVVTIHYTLRNDAGEVLDWGRAQEPPPEIFVMPGAPHFFHGRLIELREHVAAFARKTKSPAK